MTAFALATFVISLALLGGAYRLTRTAQKHLREARVHLAEARRLLEPEITKETPMTIASYRKKPVIIEAVQWIGSNQQEIHDFTGGTAIFRGDQRFGWDLVIPTLEGEHRATTHDWIIRGVQGEFYPCRADIFEATYDAVIGDAP